ncbi:hypothetical protein AB5J62_32395 [Amycolatopsis sp. cg5]|uniref:hypothetical protein n=1 Tax=Amycolatopsis sp. cg5 TaxID=3238802 RepID=UPI00352357D6
MTSIDSSRPADEQAARDLAVWELHAAMGDLGPDQHLYKIGMALPSYHIDLISQAWNINNGKLMPPMIYQAILKALEAPEQTRRHIYFLHHLASEAERSLRGSETRTVGDPAAAISSASFGALEETTVDRLLTDFVRNGKLDEATTIRNALDTLNTVEEPSLPAPLLGIKTEAEFMAHLRELRQKTGISLRDLERKMRQVDKQGGLGRTSLCALFKSDTLPSNETRMRTLVTVLLSHTATTAVPGRTSTGEINAYIRLWRRLRNDAPTPRDQAPGAIASPVETIPHTESVEPRVSAAARFKVAVTMVGCGLLLSGGYAAGVLTSTLWR